jgi:hypothetical protein
MFCLLARRPIRTLVPLRLSYLSFNKTFRSEIDRNDSDVDQLVTWTYFPNLGLRSFRLIYLAFTEQKPRAWVRAPLHLRIYGAI